MLAMEQSTREKWSVDGEEPRAGEPSLSYRFGGPKFMIARRTNGALEPLRTALPSGGEALPVFAAEQTAWRYLRTELPEAGWYVRKSHNGELASILMSLCRGVESVVLDPDPVTRASAGPGTFVDSKGFLSACLGTGIASQLSGEAENVVGGADVTSGSCRR